MRLFIALKIPDQACAEANRIKHILADSSRGVKWVEDHNLHQTVKFLGEVDDRKVPEIGQTLRNTLADQPAPVLHFTEIGFFPNPRRPRVIWLGFAGDTNLLDRMGLAVDQALAPMGFPPEKDRKPHLTLGRIKYEEGISELLNRSRTLRVENASFTVAEVILYQSVLSRQGPAYSEIEKYLLS